MDFQIILKELRLEKNISQQKLADLLRISRATVSHWEVGRIEPNIIQLKNLADVFDVSLDYLCGRTDTLELTQPYAVALNHSSKEDAELQKYLASLSKNNKLLLLGFIKMLTENQTTPLWEPEKESREKLF